MKKLFTLFLLLASYHSNGQNNIITTLGPDALPTDLFSLTGIAIDRAGNVYTEYYGRALKITSSGIVTVFAGTGALGFSGDGGLATAAQLNGALGIAVDANGNVYIAEEINERVRKIDTNGIISTIAGNGSNVDSGDGGPATAASLSNPNGVSVDGSGNIYVACDNVIRKINTSGIISRVAGGTGGYGGDGGPATSARMFYPTAIAFDEIGDMFIADRYNNRIRKVDNLGLITTFAGNGTYGFAGDGGPASSAQLYMPTGVAVDATGNVFISDGGNSRIRKVNNLGIITTIAGTGYPGYYGDGDAAISAELNGPWGVVVDAPGNVFVSDGSNYRVRKIICNTAPIAGSSAVCSGASTVLTDIYGGGTWNISNTSIASVSSGIVTGLLPGIDTIFYTMSSICGTLTVTKIDTVYDVSAGNITGKDSVCIGSSIALTDNAPGGIWSSTAGTTAVSPSGIVTGITPGLDTIRYLVTNACGTKTALFPINVVPSLYCASIVENINEQNINTTIYPNPATQNIVITSTKKILNVTIQNVLGSVMINHECNTDKLDLNVETLPSGFYLLKVNGTEAKKFLKQ